MQQQEDLVVQQFNFRGFAFDARMLVDIYIFIIHNIMLIVFFIFTKINDIHGFWCSGSNLCL